MTGVAEVLGSRAVLRLGLVLVHFVWQGTALALVALIVLGLLRRASAPARYIALLMALAAMGAAPLVTFLALPGGETPQGAVAAAPLAQPELGTTTSAPIERIGRAVAAVAPPPPAPTEAAQSSWRLRMSAAWSWLQGRLAWVAGLWVTGVTVLSLRLLVGWWRMVGSKRRGVELSGARWRQMLMSLSHRLRVGRTVRLLESAAARVPTVMGWLRPVILLPPSVLAGVTPQQLEALIAHELAHIRRHDYLVNLAQAVVETLLFYHPAVWWLSSRIRAEREHCCDGVAAAVCGDAVVYAGALAELEQLRGATAELVVAASGGSLLARVRRVLGVAEPRREPFASWQAGAIAAGAILALTAGLQIAASPAEAGGVREAWRSPFGKPRAVAVNAADGSCWALTGSSLMHLAADGSVLKQIDGFPAPVDIEPSLAVNPRDGSCWAPDPVGGEVVHLAADGKELWRGGEFSRPAQLAVNPEDGSCWVTDFTAHEVAHLAEDGRELWRGGDFLSPSAISVNPRDGSCWVTGGGEVVHLAQDGRELWRGGALESPISVAVNPTDGSCWAGDYWGSQVVHLAGDGTELWRGKPFDAVRSLSVNAADGSCWVAAGGRPAQVTGDLVGAAVAHIASDGRELWRGDGFDEPLSVSVNASDGSCWVAEWGKGDLVHLAQDGSEIWRRGGGFHRASNVSANPSDGSCWVSIGGEFRRDAGEYVGSAVVQLDRDGRELRRGGALKGAGPLCVNPADGSCWVVDYRNHQDGHQLVHLAKDGRELWRGGEFKSVRCIEVNGRDGSCWIADGGNDQVVHLAADGSELRRGDGFRWAASVSVNPRDGSCWVAAMGSNEVAHLAEDGTELWRGGGLPRVSAVSVNPRDGSCWAAARGDVRPGARSGILDCAVVHLAEDGTELWRGEDFDQPRSVSVDPRDGSCWVADTANNQVVLLAENGDELWRGGGFLGPSCVSANPADGSCWVADYQHYQVVRLARGGFGPPQRENTNKYGPQGSGNKIGARSRGPRICRR